MIGLYDLMAGSLVMYSDQFGEYEGIVSKINTQGERTCQLENHGAHFAYSGLKPVPISRELLLRSGFEETLYTSRRFNFVFPTMLHRDSEALVYEKQGVFLTKAQQGVVFFCLLKEKNKSNWLNYAHELQLFYNRATLGNLRLIPASDRKHL
jgi:hypothetical protein